jgi:glycosyltransferase involved in cell wall biosynthesis
MARHGSSVTAPADPVTVVHVLGKLDRGGVETVLLNLCRSTPVTEIRHVVLTMGDGEGRLAPQFRSVGAEVLRCPLRPMPLFPLRLWWSLRTVRPHAVVGYVSLVSGLVLTVAAAARVPVRVARLSSDGDGRSDTPRRIVQRRVLRELLRRFATHVIGNTTAGLEFAAPPPGGRNYWVWPDGIDVDRFAAARSSPAQPRGAPTLVHIGRAAPEKNRGFLLRVHAEVKQIDGRTRLAFVGPGGTADLEAVEPDVLADPLVDLHGETDQVERVLSGCDVLLLPSVREGLPGVVLEALSAGVPVLASDLAGLRELAREVDGLTLLPLSAGPQAWAREALRLAELPAADRDRISDGMRSSRFALRNSVNRWRALWVGR